MSNYFSWEFIRSLFSFKNLELLLIVITAVILIKSLITLFSPNKLRAIKKPIGLSAICYKFYSNIPLLSREVGFMELNLRLLKGGNEKAKVYASVYLKAISCCIFLAILICVTFIDVWYYCVLIAFFGVLIPYFAFMNHVDKKARIMKYVNIRYLEASEKFFSDGYKTFDVMKSLTEVVSPSFRWIYSGFITDYLTDRFEAYANYVEIFNDLYSESFIKELKRFDEEGIEPQERIREITKLGNRYYRAIFASKSAIGKFRIFAYCIAGMVIAFSVCADNLSYAMHDAPGDMTLTYIALAIVMLAVVLSYIYERF